jgi:hypothetical protein
MPWKPQQIKVDETDRMELYGPKFAIMVSCECGHQVEAYSTWAMWKLGPAVTLGQFKAHLRCSRCARRMPRIEVFRRPRD